LHTFTGPKGGGFAQAVLADRGINRAALPFWHATDRSQSSFSELILELEFPQEEAGTMIVRPNKTMVTAIVCAIRPSDDGAGRDVELEIRSNDSAISSDDFVRPEPGSKLTAFTARDLALVPGATIKAELGLSAGPFSERTILRNAQPAG